MPQYVDLSDFDIGFKHLVSGPAPVGRILNYLILTGRGILRHISCRRDLRLTDNVASAWCSEFMVGLGLVFYVENDTDTSYPLQLTEEGRHLYGFLQAVEPNFDEKHDLDVKRRLKSISEEAYTLFFNIFKMSPVCRNLCIFIEDVGSETFVKSDFMSSYYTSLKIHYEGVGRVGAGNAGFNRLPSLLQLCKFFDCLTEDNIRCTFDNSKLSDREGLFRFVPLSPTRVENLTKETERQERAVEDLEGRYGVDGNVVREVITRNGNVQDIFRNNLIARYGCKCAICNKNIETMLVASHILPSSRSTVVEKANCENGLLLCSLHDRLFDRHLISFDKDTGALMYADVLRDVLGEYQLSEDLVLEERFMTEERKQFLEIHNNDFNVRNGT